MAGPALQIRGGPGHPDPEIRGGGTPLEPQFGHKIRGEPGPLPWSATAKRWVVLFIGAVLSSVYIQTDPFAQIHWFLIVHWDQKFTRVVIPNILILIHYYVVIVSDTFLHFFTGAVAPDEKVIFIQCSKSSWNGYKFSRVSILWCRNILSCTALRTVIF